MNRMRDLLEAHLQNGQKLTVGMVSIDRNEPNDSNPPPIEDYVLVEGSSDSLKFFGNLLIAFAEGDFGCNFHLHPRGAGMAHFSDASEIGIITGSRDALRR